MEALPSTLVVYVPHFISRRTASLSSPLGPLVHPFILDLAVDESTELRLSIARQSRRTGLVIRRMPVARHHNRHLGRLAFHLRREKRGRVVNGVLPRIYLPPLHRVAGRLTATPQLLRLTRCKHLMRAFCDLPV